ncbi:Hypothetical predicted protein [Mytilus galloprovincialis]|uniref:Uncharacterized protein n=1 Tax=Mytilus galloprovincialis TaxID=29158 RepID=A0A8B6HI34_MYTGA|nr:Hypothetical predicted protein [Mytilus galloprovincialis]
MGLFMDRVYKSDLHSIGPKRKTDLAGEDLPRKQKRSDMWWQKYLGKLLISHQVRSRTRMHGHSREHVPFKIKEKIWEGKFEELHSLLRTQKEMEEVDEGDLKLKRGKICIEKRSSGVYLSLNE